MAKEAIESTVFKYLSAFQLMILVFTLFMNLYGFDTDREILMGICILLVAAFVYKKDKDNKVELHAPDMTSMEEMTLRKAVSFINEAFGLKDKKQAEIDLLIEKIAELQTRRETEEEDIVG